MKITWKRVGLLTVFLAIVTGFYLAMREKPILVDIATVHSGLMEVTIDEEGMTQVRDVYAISSPIAGYLDRSSLAEGQVVEAGKTVVATIHPMDPPLLDQRTTTELAAAVEAARSAVAVAELALERARTALALSQSEYARASQLGETRLITESELDKYASDVKLRRAEVASARAVIRLRQAELASAEARMIQPRELQANPHAEDCCIYLRSPVDGVVLEVITKSEQAVAAGTLIARVGDPSLLEVVVDLLSSDATKIRPGVRAILTEWGGGDDIGAVVSTVEPSAFTKVSALGIEEQRVNTLLDLDTTPPQLGHGYRVVVRMTIWSKDDVVQVPIGALFRSGGSWSVFVVEDGVASLRNLEIGQMNQSHAEVLEGLQVDEDVILYPNDVLEHGSLVDPRA
jgi:HlyD family secretion protein